MTAREASALHYPDPLEIKRHKCWKMQLRIRTPHGCSKSFLFSPKPCLLPSGSFQKRWCCPGSEGQTWPTNTSHLAGAELASPLDCSSAAGGCSNLNWGHAVPKAFPFRAVIWRKSDRIPKPLPAFLPYLWHFSLFSTHLPRRGIFWQVTFYLWFN